MNNFNLLRKRADKTQGELAKQLGVSQSTVAMWESGQSKPRADMLIKLSRILNCTTDELLGIEKTPTGSQV